MNTSTVAGRVSSTEHIPVSLTSHSTARQTFCISTTYETPWTDMDVLDEWLKWEEEEKEEEEEDEEDEDEE
ncbi:hypothetical protein PoB_006162500 [Plakobranchus ocellatus]|uniref:Uncharacterized protein n=1 Tax=Plakobranchus ocellatus TaxID=259542 RepID=A0AAV4CTI9_9GAST|nr:hypothetical protein PoB_006162500 [Plakobranchus ocellatus]